MAKRMVLVDEKLLEYQPMFQTKQDMSWKRPTEQSVKSTISHQMKSTLDDPTLPEDVKAKQYTQNLSRFLNTKRKLVAEPTETAEVATQPPKLDETPPKKKRKLSPRSKRKPSEWKPITDEDIRLPEPKETPLRARASTRIRLRMQQPKPFKWDEWH